MQQAPGKLHMEKKKKKKDNTCCNLSVISQGCLKSFPAYFLCILGVISGYSRSSDASMSDRFEGKRAQIALGGAQVVGNGTLIQQQIQQMAIRGMEISAFPGYLEVLCQV